MWSLICFHVSLWRLDSQAFCNYSIGVILHGLHYSIGVILHGGSPFLSGKVLLWVSSFCMVMYSFISG